MFMLFYFYGLYIYFIVFRLKTNNMSPKEKALELIGNMGFSTGVSMDAKTGEFHPMYRNQYAKQCALVAVDEIFKTGLLEGTTLGINKKYWQEVKQEIEKL